MSAIHFDYVMGCAAIDIFVLLTISIGIVAEMHRNRPPHRRVVTNKQWQSPDGHQTLTIEDRTWREPSDVNVISYGAKL
jgi:hypothetical protein